MAGYFRFLEEKDAELVAHVQKALIIFQSRDVKLTEHNSLYLFMQSSTALVNGKRICVIYRHIYSRIRDRKSLKKRTCTCAFSNFASFEKEISVSFTPRLFAPSRHKGNVIIGVSFMRPDRFSVPTNPADPSTASILPRATALSISLTTSFIKHASPSDPIASFSRRATYQPAEMTSTDVWPPLGGESPGARLLIRFANHDRNRIFGLTVCRL